MTKPNTGAHHMCEALIREGVDVLFGIPGGYIMPFYHVLPDYPQIRHVLCRHEQDVGHAADGYARASGKVGVCVATSGPGATNLATALATALCDNTPLVAITGQVSTWIMGTDGFQETDIIGVTMPLTKHNYLVRNANDLPHVFHEAFHLARSGCPGPVLIDVPKDMQQATRGAGWSDYTPAAHNQYAYAASTHHVVQEATTTSTVANTDPTGQAAHTNGHASPVNDALWHIIDAATDRPGTAERQWVVTDGDQPAIWEENERGWHVHAPHILTTRMGTRGFALPAAMGMALARPQDTIWAIVGSSGFQASQRELQTMLQEGIANIRIVVLTGTLVEMPYATNDHTHWRESMLAGPDIVALARAYGIHATRANGWANTHEAIACADARNGISVVEVALTRRRDDEATARRCNEATRLRRRDEAMARRRDETTRMV